LELVELLEDEELLEEELETPEEEFPAEVLGDELVVVFFLDTVFAVELTLCSFSPSSLISISQKSLS